MLSTSTSNSSFLNANSNVNGEFENDDRIQILDCDSTRTYQEPLSQIRRICFIASIVGTFLVVLVFLLLPCESNCVASTGFMKTRNWINNYEKMEMKGDINTVTELSTAGPKNLVFMYRSNKIFPDINNIKKSNQKNNGGVVVLNGNDGKISWTRNTTNEPRSIDCNLIDCDKSGTKDCLIIDEYGYLSCLDVNGHFIYYISNQKATKQARKDLLDFPLILPDLNGDKVNEIMMISATGKSNTTDLIILSGSNGQQITKETQNCSFVHKLQLEENYIIKYVCIVKENSEQQMIKNLTDFYTEAPKPPLNLKKLEPVSKINQHKYYGQRPGTEKQLSITEVQDKKLMIVNTGSWPRDSKATIILTMKAKGGEKILYNNTFSKTYAMVPVPLSLSGSTFKKGDNIHGFVIKFWIWNGTEVNYDLEKTRLRRSAEKRDLKAQRSNYTNQTLAGSSSSYKTKVYFLKESIMLMIFNNSKMRTENASQSNIAQFCQRTLVTKDKKSDVDSICQPDLNYQENSVLITDIDGDGTKELVSFYSTFVNDNGDAVGDRWKLKTFIQLFKLEKELPKFYSDLNIY